MPLPNPSAGDDILAQHIVDIVSAIKQMPPIFSVMANNFDGSSTFNALKSIYSDDKDYFIAQLSGSTVLVMDGTSGGDCESHAMTTEWAECDGIAGVAKIGAYLYVCCYDNATTSSRVYRFAAQDLASGGTLMTVAGTAFGTTATIDSMITDGTNFYFNSTKGDAASTRHIWGKYTLSGTTITFVSDITCGSDDTYFNQSAMDHSGNFYGTTSAGITRRYDSSGTLQATLTRARNSGQLLRYVFYGIPYYCQTDGDSSNFMRCNLMP